MEFHDGIPKGWNEVAAYAKGDRVIILGKPTEEPDDWADDDPRRHNCDEMGCGQDHVLARLQMNKPLNWE